MRVVTTVGWVLALPHSAVTAALLLLLVLLVLLVLLRVQVLLLLLVPPCVIFFSSHMPSPLPPVPVRTCVFDSET